MARAGSERIVCRISSEKSFWGYTRHVRAGSLTAPSAAKSPWPSTRHLCTIERHIIRLMTRSLSPFGRSRPSAPADTNLRGWHFVWFSQEDSEETGIGTEFSLPVGSREPPSKPPGGARIYVRLSVHSFSRPDHLPPRQCFIRRRSTFLLSLAGSRNRLCSSLVRLALLNGRRHAKC